MIVDLHSHYFPLEAVRATDAVPVEATERPNGSYEMTIGGHAIGLTADLFDVDAQLAALRQEGLDRRALMVPPFTALYELPAEQGAQWSRVLNDGIAATTRAHPDAFVGFATMPLQDAEAAAGEVDRVVRELGLQGVEILTSINGVGLDTPWLDPFWARAEALRVPILIHPHYVSGAERMGDYHLRNLIGNPAETAQAGARLLFGGVLERFPGLKIILSHGGGALPHLIGRLRHGYEVRPETHQRAASPIEQIGRLYYDSIVFDRTVLRHVVEIVGASQVVLGTDYPFDMSETDPIGFIRESGLSHADVETILNAGDRLLDGVGSAG